jgi:cytochrome c553
MQPAEPEALDRPWRLWASVIIVGVLAFSVVFGFLVLPVVQGYAAGVDPFTAICRAVGLAPGSPAMRQPTSAAKAQPTTQVAWSTDLLRTLARPGLAGAEVAQACVACHGERGISPDPKNPHLAGQSGVAIYKQLHDYKSGSRAHDLMTGIAQELEDQQISDVPAHFARPTASRSIPQQPRWPTRTSSSSSSGAIRRAAFLLATRATARPPADRSKRRRWRGRTATTSPRSSAPLNPRNCAASKSARSGMGMAILPRSPC